jgi:hypothetical protein
LAITIGPGQEVELGTPVDVPILIFDLGDRTAPSLSTFDLSVLFDPLILAFNSVDFGDPFLGDQLDLFGLGSITSVGEVPPDLVLLFELSLDSPADLNALQAPAFILATLTFDTVGLGATLVEISANSLGDAFGDPLTADFSSGIVNVIPEPGSALLLAAAAVILAPLRRYRSNGR